MRYKIICCKRCGRHSAVVSENVFKCHYCNTSESMKKRDKHGFGVNLKFTTDSGLDAARKVGELNAK